MPFTFTPQHVTPGVPVTAQGWNEIVDGLSELQDAVSAKGGTVRVSVTGNALDIAAARVFATDAQEVRFQAVQPASGSVFMFPSLAPGAYEILVTAPSCTSGHGSVTVADDGTATPATVNVSLVFTGDRMPNVLGRAWQDVVDELAPVNALALDAAGRGVPLTHFDRAYAEVPVLMQWPAPQEIVSKVKHPLVVVAPPPERLTTLNTPDLLGKTVAEAQAQLAELGLELRIV